MRKSAQPWASYLMPVVRVKPGYDLGKANAELDVIASRLDERFGTGQRPFSYWLRPFVQPARSIRHGSRHPGGRGSSSFY